VSRFALGLPLVGLVGLVAAGLLHRMIRTIPAGEEMTNAGRDVHRASGMFLFRLNAVLSLVLLPCAALLAYLIAPLSGLAFLAGAAGTMAAGLWGMRSVTRTSVYVAEADRLQLLAPAFFTTLKGGAVAGLSVAGLGLMGIGTGLILFEQGILDIYVIPGFALGAAAAALLLSAGGGVFAKSAEAGAVQVGRIEAEMPPDDPRNSLVLADLTGDCVGRATGLTAGLFAGHVGTVIAVMAVAAAGSSEVLGILPDNRLDYIGFPVVLTAIGLFASLIGILAFRVLQNLVPATALRTAGLLSIVLMLAGSALAVNAMGLEFGVLAAVLVGALTGMALAWISQWTASADPAKRIARSSHFGIPANLVTGLTTGMQSAAAPFLLVCGSALVAHNYGGFYGIGIAAATMLTTVGITLTISLLGPIQDTAAGIYAWNDRRREAGGEMQDRSNLGGVAESTGKELEVGSAVLTALVLVVAYARSTGLNQIDLVQPVTVVGLIVGGILPVFVGQLILSSTGRAMIAAVAEARRRSHEKRGLLEGGSEQDRERCLEILTTAAVKGMILPGLAALFCPVLIGWILGPEALGGMIAGTILAGGLMSFFMNASGAAWSSAALRVERDMIKESASEAFIAAMAGYAVGNTLKDAAEPTVDTMIRLVPFIALVIAPLL